LSNFEGVERPLVADAAKKGNVSQLVDRGMSPGRAEAPESEPASGADKRFYRKVPVHAINSSLE